MSCRSVRHRHPDNVHFYSSSGGNTGLACVHVAKTLNREASVRVPLSTSASMIQNLRDVGATEVLQYGASCIVADSYLRSAVLAKNTDGVYVPPFDNEDIWTGNSSLIDEVASQLKSDIPDAIICSVGGGGLLNGLIMGMDRHCWTNIPLIAMETCGADSLQESLRKGKLVTLPKISSQATSLGATRVAARTFENAQRPNHKNIVLEDFEAALDCLCFADDRFNG